MRREPTYRKCHDIVAKVRALPLDGCARSTRAVAYHEPDQMPDRKADAALSHQEGPVFIDTHIHLDDARYKGDLAEVLAAARGDGVMYAICPGCDMESSERARSIAQGDPGIYFGIGCHPHEAQHISESFFPWARSLGPETVANGGKLAAVGEIGLDYHYDLSPRDIQREVFAEQVGLAKELRLPIIVHDREAHGDTLDVLKSSGACETGGVLHCYSGSWEMARTYLDMGFYISFAGPVTFKNASKLREVAEKVPVDRILAETDGPYLTPEPFRGGRNEPRHVVRVVETLATLHGMDPAEMAGIILRNAGTLFGIASDLWSELICPS